MIVRAFDTLKSCSFAVKCLLLVTVLLLVPLGFQSAAINAEEGKKEGQELQNGKAGDLPGHDIRYEDNLSPDWKVKWDLARKLYREEKFREALVLYELLLSQKENIDEARWEYATLLLRQERWQDAEEQVEKLLSGEPDNIEYQFALAAIKRKTGSIDAAVEMYKKLYVAVTEEANLKRALEGLTGTLEEAGDQMELLFYLEKLIALDPENQELRLRKTRISVRTGQHEKALVELEELERKMPDNLAVLNMQAELSEARGDAEALAGYLQKIVSLNPDDLEAHAKLHQYYRDRENWAMSLNHLEVLLGKTPNAPVLLEEAADTNIRLGRLDRALEYFDYLLALNPNNKTILQKKKDAQKAFAEDLVVLVENNGSEKLWQDLVQVTSDRAGVYRQIADLLRVKNNTDELVEVLTLIYLEDPSDDGTLAELTELLRKKGRIDELNDLQDEIQSRKQKK